VTVAAGVALGTVAAYAAAGTAAAWLFGLRPHGPPTYIGAAVLLTVVSGIAAAVPAVRAAAADPLRALRCE
jgi:ABC-type antimicrobial peptide transport system permease subunit